MFAINAFGLPIVFGLANLIDLFGRNWEIYKTRKTNPKARNIWRKEVRKYLICFPFYLVVPFEKSFLFPEEEERLLDSRQHMTGPVTHNQSGELCLMRP